MPGYPAPRNDGDRGVGNDCERSARLTAATRDASAPVRTGGATGYPWSSAAAHLAGRDDRLVVTEPLLRLEPDWGAFLARGLSEERAPARALP